MDDIMNDLYGASSVGGNAQNGSAAPRTEQVTASSNAGTMGYSSDDYTYDPRRTYGGSPDRYAGTQNNYGRQPADYGSAQNGYGRQPADYGDTQLADSGSAYSTTPDFWGTESTLESRNSDFMTAVLGVLGAAIGAVPGFFLIMGLARFGIIASLCGAALAAGTFFGFYIATRSSRPTDKQKTVICIAVMALAVFFAVRISWTYKLRDVLIISKSYTDSIIASNDEYSNVTAESIDQGYNILFGFSEPTYSNCSANFGKILTNLNLKGKFALSLLENYVFCALGGFWLLSKFGKSKF